MFALLETAEAINLFKNDKIIGALKFKDSVHARKTYEKMNKGTFPDEVVDFLVDNEVNEIIVDKSLIKASQNEELKGIKFREDLKKLRPLREHLRTDMDIVRGLSHVIAHKNVNLYTLDPLIVQSYALLKQVESDMEKYDKRAAEIYFSYLPELKIKKRKENMDDDRVELKESYDIEVIKNLWRIKERDDSGERYQWVRHSVGIDLTESDWDNLQRIIDLFNLKRENHQRLTEYLKEKVTQHAPNTVSLIGHRVTAELITQAGSLVNLAKCSSSTVQVLGAEKALFRSLKNKTPTPKYGILKKNGLTNSPRIIRGLASKIVICARIDAFRPTKTDVFGKALREAIDKKVHEDKRIDTTAILKKVSEELEDDAKNEESILKSHENDKRGSSSSSKETRKCKSKKIRL